MTSILQYFIKRIKYICSLIVLISYISIIDSYCITANFDVELKYKCVPAVAIFKNLSTQGTGITYKWNFGLGTIIISSSQVLEEVYTTPGPHTITLTVSQGAAKDSISKTIDIFIGPTAKFAIDTSQGCVPFQVKFTNTSTGGKGFSDVIWDFRDGSILKGNTVSHTYSFPGKYDILLTVIDSNECTAYVESKNLIVAVDKPKAAFSVTDSFACSPPLNVSFINNSTGQPELHYQWNFGNGTTSTETNKSVAYTKNGNYNVKLVVTDVFNCKDSLTRNSLIRIGNLAGSIYARYEDGAILHKALLCPGKIFFGFSLANQSDYKWTVTYKNNTQYIYNKSEFELLAPDSGTVNIILECGQQSDCPRTLTSTFIIDYIKADFSIDYPNGCELPHKINIINESLNTISYTWKLPPDFVSNNKNISYTIPWDSSYRRLYSHKSFHSESNILLVAANANGCKDSISKKVNIDLPVARFMPDKVTGCVPLTVTLSDSSDSELPIEKWIYKIGSDSIVSTTGAPVVQTFNNPGEYNIILIIRNSQGCTDTSYGIKIRAGAKLSPDFTVSKPNVCYNDTLLLSGSITGQSNLKDSINWWHYSCPGVFNTGSQKSSDAKIVIRTDTGGIKNITLEADYNGCISSITKKNAFTVKGPMGNFFETFRCDSPLNYTFISGIAPADSLKWKIDTATIDNKDSINYTFPGSSPGPMDYVVQLTAKDKISGCTLTRKKIIPVKQVKADFKVDPVSCVGNITGFNASLSKDTMIQHCYKEGFLWDFNDFSPPRRSYTSLYNYVYFRKGYYHPLLTVISDNGCIDTISKQIRITKPFASFTINKNQGCTPEVTVQFTNTSADNTIDNFRWDFGDSHIDLNSSVVNHTYVSLSGRTYYAKITVSDSFNCSASADTTISLINATADFQASDNAICVGETTTFSIMADGVDSYKWDFGDGVTTNISNSHTYNSSGLFDVTLVNQFDGCIDTVKKTQYINVEKANAEFSVSDSFFKCYPAVVTFNNFGSSSHIVSGIWDFGDGSHSNGYSVSPQYSYTRTGTFNATLNIKTLNKCQSSASKTIVVTGPTADFDFSPKIICYGDQVSFHINETHNVNETKWLFGDGDTSNLTSPTHRYYTHGSIVPSLWVKNDDCVTSISTNGIFISKILAKFDFRNLKTSVCLGQEIVGINHSQYYSSSVWKLDDAVYSTKISMVSFNPDHPGNFNVKLIASDNYHCSDSISKIFTVIPLPDFQITGDTSICKDIDSTHLKVTSNPLWSINWTPTNGLSNPASFDPYAKPEVTTWYVASVNDTGGCASKDSIKIFVRQPSNITYYPSGDTSINIGERIQLNVLTTGPNTLYQWSPNYRISCRTCSNPFVAPEQNTTYKVISKDECFNISKEFNITVIINFFLEAPKAFTPNGDGNNDVFKFVSDNIKIFDLKIFNRWGNLIFTSDNPDKGWDGTYNGKLQNIDTYNYTVKAETGSGYKFERKGSFLLLK